MTDVQVFSDSAADQLNQLSSDHLRHQLIFEQIP
jgi:hypothetical protein